MKSKIIFPAAIATAQETQTKGNRSTQGWTYEKKGTFLSQIFIFLGLGVQKPFMEHKGLH